MARHGFTLVEVVITITIIGLLLIIAAVSLNASQMNARDAERRTDVEGIALHLESFYSSGSDTLTPGGYPGTDQIASEASIKSALRDIDTANLRAPNYSGTGTSLVAATNATQTTSGVSPQPTINQYVYQPINNSTLCTSTAAKCTKFVLYYRSEISGTVQMIKSRNQ